MKLLLLLIATFVSSQIHANDFNIIGTWKSNAKMTLKSMNENPNVTKKAKELFSNDFFGHLIVIVRKKDSASYFDNEPHENLIYEPYRILEKNKDFMVTEYNDVTTGELEKTNIYFEGDCYYLLISKWQFREYFCRIQ